MIEAPKALSGVSSGDGFPSPAEYWVYPSVVSSPSGVRGVDPATDAFLTYFGSQNTSGRQKNAIFVPSVMRKIH